MNNPLTLGSLFDGSGTFPVAGILSGIKPIWASEIEPFCIRVTTKKLPFIKHLGDINNINGAEIEPVDIITFGSPCTDLSIAGKRAGLNAERSGLFFQAVRVIKEMRCATNGKYPRYCVWENVMGCFSSNGGEDFRTVLEELCKIKDSTISVPRPEKWSKSGEIVADGFSLAWRTLDAQYWGVPQRRKRIYLVADFDGGCASKILFKSEGVSGYSAESFRAWQKTARSTADCFGTSVEGLMFENHSQDTRYTEPVEVTPTILSAYGTGGNNQPFVVDIKAYSICSKYSNSMISDNPDSGFYETDTARTIDTGNQSPCKNQGGMVVIKGNGSRSSHHGDGCSESDTMYTLNTVETHAAAFSQDTYNKYSENSQCGTLRASGGVYGGGSEALICPSDKQYTVRRLNPKECALLQGMLTWWCDSSEI